MSGSSKAPFSFHCVICIEPFNVDDRVPVVLPCGHTYLCALCAARLQRCMECRTSLFLNTGTASTVSSVPPSPPPPPPSPMSPYSARVNSTSSRYGYSNNSRGGYVGPLVKAEKVRLPLPKNLVLLDLMQAAEGTDMVEETIPGGEWSKEEKVHLDNLGEGGDTDTKEEGTEETEGAQSSGDDCESRVPSALEDARNMSASVHLLDNDTEDGYESGDDDERVLDSIRGAVCEYGTYAVREKDGLFILPHHPMRRGQEDEDLFVELDRMPSGDTSPSAERARRGRSSDKSLDGVVQGADTGLQWTKAAYGYRIQVVSNREGVAKLARGAGYIVADSEQLAKVGPPTDKACTLEGMIRKATSNLEHMNSSVKTLTDQRSSLIAQLKHVLRFEASRCAVVQTPQHDEDDEDGSQSIEKRESQDTGHEDASVKLSPSEAFRHGESDGEMSYPPLDDSTVHSPPTVISHQLQLPELTKEHALPDRRIARSADATDPTSRQGFTNILDSCSDSGRLSLPNVPDTSRQASSIASRSIDLGCSGFFGERYLSDGDDTENDRNVAIEMGYDEAVRLVAASGAAVGGNTHSARAPPNGIALAPRRSAPLLEELGGFHVVNFRTGLSGHMGLTRSDRDRRPLLTPRNEVRQMGEHRGISTIKRIRPKAKVGSPVSPRRAAKTLW